MVGLGPGSKDLGLPISADQIIELEEHVSDIDLEFAARKEKELRHDVMSHIATYGEVCPTARPIIHLGATSCYVTDNTELILMKNSLGSFAKSFLIY